MNQQTGKRESKIVGWCSLNDFRVTVTGSGIKLHTRDDTKNERPQWIIHILSNIQKRALIATTVAVIGRRKHCDNVLIMAPMESLKDTPKTNSHVHNKLMSPNYQTKAVFAIEFVANVSAKRITRSSGRDSPSGLIAGIRPQQVAHAAFVANINNSIQLANLIQCENGRW